LSRISWLIIPSLLFSSSIESILHHRHFHHHLHYATTLRFISITTITHLFTVSHHPHYHQHCHSPHHYHHLNLSMKSLAFLIRLVHHHFLSNRCHITSTIPTLIPKVLSKFRHHVQFSSLTSGHLHSLSALLVAAY
jgi:hypothetical protein